MASLSRKKKKKEADSVPASLEFIGSRRDRHQPSDTEVIAMNVGGSVVRKPSTETEHSTLSFLLPPACRPLAFWDVPGVPC